MAFYPPTRIGGLKERGAFGFRVTTRDLWIASCRRSCRDRLRAAANGRGGRRFAVHTWLKTFHFNLDEVRSVEEIEPDELSWRNTFRLCAVGWPLKPYGYLWNRERGLLLAMVSDRSGMVLLDTGKKLILVSPENPRDLVLEMQNRPA